MTSKMRIAQLLEIAKIEFKTPLDQDWSLYSTTYNSRVPVTPKIVVLPADTEEVSCTVSCANVCGLKVQARSGGHSYASHSSGGVDGSMVIDLRKLQQLDFCEDGTVCAGAGVRLGYLAESIFTSAGAAIAHGTCPSVGIGGHFTHGGFGMLSRAWGLAMDHIVGLQVVMANGELITVKHREPILMAMRGAADSFGIIVNFYLRTQQAPEAVVKWNIDIPEAMTSVKNAVETFELGTADDFSLVILTHLLGFLPHKRGIEVKFFQSDWLNLLREMAGGTPLVVDPSIVTPQCFFAKSAAVANPGLSRDDLEEYFTYLLGNGARTSIDYFIGVQLYGGADSQITSGSYISDSFGNRDAMWIFQHYGSPKGGLGSTEFPDEGIRFIEGLNKALGPGHGASSNYPDPSLKRDEALRLYYGAKLEALMELKGELDPEDLFSHPQSIPPKIR